MQDSSLSDAAQLGRSSLAAAVPEPSAGPAAAGAPTPLGMPARHDETASNRPSDHGGHPYQHHARGSSYSAAPRGGHFATDPTANRPSLADYGHAGSAPVQSTSKWFESGASPGTHRPLSVPLPTSAPLDHRPSHRQSQEDASARTFPPISRLHQQWSKPAQSQYTPYRMSIAPEPPRPAGGSGEAGAEAARMQAPSYPTYQSAPYSGHAPTQSSSYTYPPPTSHGEPAYPQPLSLTLPPLSNAFPSEPFALTATYPPPSDNSHARYGTSGMLNQQQTAEPASLAGSSRPHHLPTIQESYKSYQPMPMPLTASMPRANGAESPSYAESISAAVPPGSAQPNSRKRKEPKDAATRKYACNECEQKFARPSALATHILTHTREKPFVCTTCNRGFAVMSNLRRHCRVRSHALAPSQESNSKRMHEPSNPPDEGEYPDPSTHKLASGLTSGDPDRDENAMQSLPAAPSAHSSPSFALPAQHLYPT